jgi:hypothetical protein
MIEVQCPITGEQTHWPDCKADMVPSLLELSEQFEIAIEDVFTMAKITAELGEDWFEDSLEFNDYLVWDINDKQLLKMAKRGECELSITELLAIRDRARAGLELLLRHERDPKKRTKLQALLRETRVWKANRALAKAMLEKQRLS